MSPPIRNSDNGAIITTLNYIITSSASHVHSFFNFKKADYTSLARLFQIIREAESKTGTPMLNIFEKFLSIAKHFIPKSKLRQFGNQKISEKLH